MILTVASFKGGVAKTTTAIHMAAYLQRRFPDAPTLLIDGDPNRSATGWARRGELPFRVVDERQAARYVKDAEHVVIDTQARPAREDLAALVDGCDLLVIPSTPDALALDALLATVDALRDLKADEARFRILLTIVPPKPSNDGEEARTLISSAELPIFAAEIGRRAAFTKAALQGVPVYSVADPRAERAWAEYLAVGKEIAP
jgi:chromosome partitioning protein